MSAVLNSPVPLSNRKLCNMVDKLGAVNAQIAALQLEADAIKGTLRCLGLDEVIGKSYRAVISVRTSTRLDTTAVKGFLSPAQITAASRTTKSISVSLYDL